MIRFCFLSLLVVLTSCGAEDFYNEVKSIKGSWKKGQKIVFDYNNSNKDPHDIFIILRNDDTFEYSNIFLITEIESPGGEVTSDTLEYEMAEANGKWLGSGLGGVKEHLLWYKENMALDSLGKYTIAISQAMRKNGTLEGIRDLKGILDVGLQIKKHRHQPKI